MYALWTKQRQNDSWPLSILRESFALRNNERRARWIDAMDIHLIAGGEECV
jgi:hypothetical protein